MSSISRNGRPSHHNDNYTAYADESGSMDSEYTSPSSDKKVIDLTALDESYVEHQWLLADLYERPVALDIFADGVDGEIFDYADILAWCLRILSCSTSTHALIAEAIDQDWVLTLDDLGGTGYALDVEEGMLSLDHNALVPSALGRSSYFRNVTMITLVKALRDVWQERRHGGFDEVYTPESVVMLERLRAADLDVFSVLAAWEIRVEGYEDLWRTVLGSDQGDMAMIFSGFVEREPGSQFNGQALKACFMQWYRDDSRINACDRETLDYLDDVLCHSSAINPFGVKRPGKMAIEVISVMPNKSAYLQGLGAEILADPVYTDIANEINAAHLTHILYDLEAIVVEDVPFRDAGLARKIFPIDEN